MHMLLVFASKLKLFCAKEKFEWETVYMQSRIQGYHKKYTPDPEIIMENTAPYGSRRLNIPNLHDYANEAKLMLKNPNNLLG